MKKILKLLLIIITFFIVSIGCILAKEGQSMKVSLVSDKNNYKVGDEILVSILIDEINGFSGINTFLAKKVFNEEELEYVEAVVANQNWEVLGDAEKVLLRKMEGEELSKGKICTLKFKALKSGNTKIQIAELDACNDEGDVYYEDENVNSPFIEINVSTVNDITDGTSKSYLGIVLIVAGMLGIIAVVIHYIINRNKF